MYSSDAYHPKWGGSYPAKPEYRRDTGEEPIHCISFADWKQIGRDTLEARLAHQPNTGRAKNVVYFIGDGMGVTTLQSARIHKSQTDRVTLDKAKLSWDDWVDNGLCKVRNDLHIHLYIHL